METKENYFAAKEKKEEEQAVIEKGIYTDKIIVKELKKFTEEALAAYGSPEKLAVGNKVASIIYQMMRKRRFAKESHHEVHVDVLLVSALLHNLFFDPNDYTTLYMARVKLEDLSAECEIRASLADLIFDTIESQLGEDTLVAGSKPKPNTPQELFATAVWFVTEYKPEKELS